MVDIGVKTKYEIFLFQFFNKRGYRTNNPNQIDVHRLFKVLCRNLFYQLRYKECFATLVVFHKSIRQRNVET